jgi:hypothetical protein
MRFFGPLNVAGLEILSADPVTNLFDGRMYLNTISAKPRIYVSSAWNDFDAPQPASAYVEVITANTTYTSADLEQYIVADATAGSVTVTLPSVATVTGREFAVKKQDSSANSVIVSGTIDGGSSITLTTQNESVRVVSDGTSYRIIGSTQRTRATGIVPVGAVIAVMSNLTGSLTLPASGAVSADGWIRCDGSAIPASQTLSGTTPNLTSGKFIYGTSGTGVGANFASGSTGGANSVTLVATNIPQISTSYTPAGTVPASGLTAAAQGFNLPSITNQTATHTHAPSSGTRQFVVNSDGSFINGTGTGSFSGTHREAATNGDSVNHTHTLSGGSNNASSVTGTATLSGSAATITVGTVGGSMTAVATLPSYVAAVYLMRVI